VTDNKHDLAPAIEWAGGVLKLLDQRLLPGQVEYLDIGDVSAAADAIRQMVVRGAPAIGITAAYAVVLAARRRYRADPQTWRETIKPDLNQLMAARPTAVNLRWAVSRMEKLIDSIKGEPAPRLLEEAQRIHAEERTANRRMGELGAALIELGSGVLTHCNAGALATGGYGTALSVVRAGFAAGRIDRIYVDETRPWLQGARLTAWELMQVGIPVTVIVDAAAAYLMQQDRIRWAIVGADRIAANGDVANKIGTYSVAVAARHHGVNFMVVAPTSTVDLDTPSGADIDIERRPEEEVLALAGRRIAPAGAQALNLAFDVTPAELVDVMVTEKGVMHRPNRAKLITLMSL